MAILSWGKCKITYNTSTDGAPPTTGAWKAVPTPKAETTKVDATEGSEIQALEEGGGVVDARYEENTYQLEFELFYKKGEDQPFADKNGVIDGEYAIRVVPEDDKCHAIQIDRAVLRVIPTYSTGDGIMARYVAKCLKPKTGNTVKILKTAPATSV